MISHTVRIMCVCVCVYLLPHQAQITNWDRYVVKLKESGEESGVRISDLFDEKVPETEKWKEKFKSFRIYMEKQTQGLFSDLHTIFTRRRCDTKLSKCSGVFFCEMLSCYYLYVVVHMLHLAAPSPWPCLLFNRSSLLVC